MQIKLDDLQQSAHFAKYIKRNSRYVGYPFSLGCLIASQEKNNQKPRRTLSNMSLKELKETRSRWPLFSKVDQLGAIDFWTLTISLDALQPKDTQGVDVKNLQRQDGQVFTLAEYEYKKKVLTLAAHEYTHFLDATSSLWGLRHLKKLNECHEVDAGNEAQFYVLKNAYDYMRSIILPAYYTTINKTLPSERPWGYDVTSGVMFASKGEISDRPVLFVNFLTLKGERIVRSPLSTISLLEASAMAKEIEVRMDLIRHLQEPEKTVENRLANEGLMSYIYNSEITEYSACFHLLANVQNEKDLGITARAVGVVCRLVLNAPEIAFKTASKNVIAYAKAMNLTNDHQEIQRLKTALDYQDRGALFFIIVVLLPKGSLTSLVSFLKNLEISLKSISLSFEKLRRAAHEEAENLSQELSTSGLQSIRELAGAGYANFKKVFPAGLDYPLEQLSIPPALHGDLIPYMFSSSDENLLKSFDLDIAYNELAAIQRRVENFAEGCL